MKTLLRRWSNSFLDEVQIVLAVMLAYLFTFALVNFGILVLQNHLVIGGGEGVFFASLAPSHGPRPGVVGRRRGRPRPPRASVVAAPPVVEAVLGAFLPASPRRRRGGRRRPRGEKVCGRPRRSENGRPGGIAHGRPRRDKDGRPPGGSWRRSHATGRGVRAAAAKQGRPAATVRGRRRNKGPAAPGGSHAAGHGGRRYAAGRGGVRTAGRGGDPAGRAGGTAAAE